MFKINYDALGIAASVACAIHCALLPLVLTSLPILGVNIINNIWFELLMILIALVIGIYSLMHGFRKHHHKKLPIAIFISGMILLVLKQVLHAQQMWFLIPAVVLIISAHYLNYTDCRKAAHCHTDDCTH
jgi:ABC-type iron transport system FetAB permease component